jgi:hypothetical protein
MAAHGEAGHVPASSSHVVHIVKTYGWLGNHQGIGWWFYQATGYPWLEVVYGGTYQENIVSPSFSQHRITSDGGVTPIFKKAREDILNREKIVFLAGSRISNK